MYKVELEMWRGWDECEDCGGFEYGQNFLSVDGEEVEAWRWDNHLGGGEEIPLKDIIESLLKHFNIEVEVKISQEYYDED